MLRKIAIFAVAMAGAPASGDYLAVTWNGGGLWRLDEATGDSVQIGSIGSGWRANAMARSDDGRFFVSAGRISGSERLFEINAETGNIVGSFDLGLLDVRSMAFGPDGTLHVVDRRPRLMSQLWSVDIDAQTVSNPMDFHSVGGLPGLQGFAIDASGQGFMAGPGRRLHHLDISTGDVFGDMPLAELLGVQSLAFNGADDLVGLGRTLGDLDASIWTFDSETGAVLDRMSIESRDYRGFEWVVPSPGALACFGAMAVLGTRRRR